MHRKTPTALVLIGLLTTGGCDNREAEIAREAADRQAAQNQTMAELQQEVVVGTKRLAENDAQSRRQTLQVHRDLQAERTQLNKGWDSLETERQSVALSRRVDSFLTVLITGGGGAWPHCSRWRLRGWQFLAGAARMMRRRPSANYLPSSGLQNLLSLALRSRRWRPTPTCSGQPARAYFRRYRLKSPILDFTDAQPAFSDLSGIKPPAIIFVCRCAIMPVHAGLPRWLGRSWASRPSRMHSPNPLRHASTL